MKLIFIILTLIVFKSFSVADKKIISQSINFSNRIAATTDLIKVQQELIALKNGLDRKKTYLLTEINYNYNKQNQNKSK